MKRTTVVTISLGALSAVVPVAFAAAVARDDGFVASCDEAVLRTLGRGYTGLFHGLDALVTSPFGRHVQWASMGTAGVLGLVAFLVARRLVRPSANAGIVLAFVGAFLATIAGPVLRESTLAFGTTLGAALVLVPLIPGLPAPCRFAAVGLALSYDVPTAIASLASVAIVGRPARWRDVAWAFAGVAPVVWMAWRRHASPDSSLEVSAMTGWLGEGAAVVPRAAGLAIVHQDLGVVAVAFAVIGLAFAVKERESRRLALALAAVIGVGIVAPALGAPAGPERFGSTLIAAVAAIAVLAASGMSKLTDAVARAPIPLARASSAMIVVLCLALPARIADDTSLAFARAPADATAAWNERVLGGLPRDAVLLVPTPALAARARAAMVTGALARTVLLVPTHGLGGLATTRAISREPLLAPVVRDLVLYGAPEELSLSELATTRPVLLAYDATLGRSIAKHLVPEGLFDRFHIEPRGAIEREKILPFAVLDPATLDAVRTSSSLRAATHDLLRARALSAAAIGERNYAQSTLAELHRLAPEDMLVAPTNLRARRP